MAGIYFYKLTTDDGGAPCVQDELLSLAICKPMIRKSAEKGDLVFGFAANSLYADNQLIYIARLTDKVRTRNYYERFGRRGDCVYEWCGDRFTWRQGALHHGQDDLVHDLGKHPDYAKAYVLLSNDFRYFGASGTANYKAQYPLIKDAVENLGRGHRVHHGESLRTEFLALMQLVWTENEQMVCGVPMSKPSSGACHRGRSCGVLEDEKPS